MSKIEHFLGVFNRTDQEDPLKVFRFHVEIDNFSRFGFTKCSGITWKTEQTKYREGGQNATPQKSPGLTEYNDVTLERGMILAAGAGDTDVLLWLTQVHDASTKTDASSNNFRRTPHIVMFSKEGAEVERWELDEAWPGEGTVVPELDAMSSNNALEKLVLCHEGARRIR